MSELQPSRRKFPKRERPPVDYAVTTRVVRKRRTRPAGPVVPPWRAAGVEPIGPDPEIQTEEKEQTDVASD